MFPPVRGTYRWSSTIMRELGIHHVLTADAHFQQVGLDRLP
jgi:predicted nucleic acid-binding protein